MANEDEDRDQGFLHRAAEKVSHVVKNLERDLTNEAAAIPGAAGDFNMAGASPATGPASVPPGIGPAAAGNLSDVEPVGYANEGTGSDETTTSQERAPRSAEDDTKERLR